MTNRYLTPEKREEMRNIMNNGGTLMLCETFEALLDHASLMDERLSEAGDEIESLNGTVAELKERVTEEDGDD